MDKNYDVINFISRRPKAANFADINKIAIIFIRPTLKDSNTQTKLKEIDIMH